MMLDKDKANWVLAGVTGLMGLAAGVGLWALFRRGGGKFGDAFPGDWVLRKSAFKTPKGEIAVKKIGKGLFTTAYVTPEDRVLAVVAPNVYDKEILAAAHQALPENPHIPAVTFRAHTNKGEQVFEMPRYKAPLRPAALKPEDRKAWKTITKCIAKVHPLSANRGYDLTHKRMECMKDDGIAPDVLEAIETINDTSADYSDNFTLEATPRNAAVDAHGNLVLLDIFFNKDAAHEAHVARLKKSYARRGA